MDNLWIYILIAILIIGGSCTVAGTWWNKKKKINNEISVCRAVRLIKIDCFFHT